LKIDYQRQRQEFDRVTAEHQALRQENAKLEAERQDQSRVKSRLEEGYRRLRFDLESLSEQHRRLQTESQPQEPDLAEVLGSTTMRLRNHLVGMPILGTWLKFFARMAAGRSG
jgi:uncharacterized protein (DUF3084 family)